MNEYTLIIRVVGKEHEPLISINQVSDSDMEVLTPLLEDIKAHQGYYPTGQWACGNGPSARDLYRRHLGWNVFDSLTPKPPSGFPAIISVSVYSEEPLKMNFL